MNSSSENSSKTSLKGGKKEEIREMALLYPLKRFLLKGSRRTNFVRKNFFHRERHLEERRSEITFSKLRVR